MIPLRPVVRSQCAKLLSIVLTAAACSPGGPTPAPTEEAGSLHHLDRLVTAVREVTGAPGLSVSIAGPTGDVATLVAGVASLETGLPVTPATRFRLASVSKAVTAVGLASLADAGLIGLDQPAREMLPELGGPIGTVTPRQLSGHLAGVRHYEPGDTALDHRHFASLRDAVEVFADDPLVEAPGERYVYSTFGYTLLGALMEVAADRPFPPKCGGRRSRTRWGLKRPPPAGGPFGWVAGRVRGVRPPSSLALRSCASGSRPVAQHDASGTPRRRTRSSAPSPASLRGSTGGRLARIRRARGLAEHFVARDNQEEIDARVHPTPTNG